MDSKEIWNIIVTSVQNNIYKKEEVIQAIWNSALFPLILDGSDCKNIEQEVPEGSTKKMDIVIKQNENTVAVVELKQHTHSRDSKAGLVTPQEQLFSYLNQLKRVNIGILVCDKLYIYNYDFTKNNEENATNCLEIPFEKDNELGEKFVEFFSRQQFDGEKVRDFILENVQQTNDILKIQRQLEEQDFVLELARKYFAGIYDAQIVEKSLAGYTFECRRKTKTAQGSFSTQHEFQNVMPKIGGTPEIEFKINGTVVEAEKFREKLLQTKRAERMWIFTNGEKEKNVWNASNFSPVSDLKANIKTSSRYRNWRINGLVKVIYEINE